MKGRGVSILSGAVLATALAGALPAGLRLSGEARDLEVTVRSPEPRQIAPARGAPLAPATAWPPELYPRLERAGVPDRDDPGLWLRTWQVTYGRRWERQVTFPVLAGPFDPEGSPWPCAIRSTRSRRASRLTEIRSAVARPASDLCCTAVVIVFSPSHYSC